MRAHCAVLCILASLAASPAQAAAVANLTAQPQLMEVPGSNAEVIIPPGQTWRVPGNMTVRWRGRDVHIRYYEEYAIWPSGDFGPQRRMRRQSFWW